MIYEVMNFLKVGLDTYLSEGRPNAEPMIKLANPRSNNDDNKNSSFLNAISLINVEEEKLFKTQLPPIVQGKNGGFFKKEPDIKLNLYIMVSAYNKNYEDALKFISKVVGYFQRNKVFQQEPSQKISNNDLPVNVEKIIVELYTLSFDQQNQVWASLSTGYIPSVIYKVRMIVIDTDTAVQEVPIIKEIKAIY
jgi:hypothetical protein